MSRDFMNLGPTPSDETCRPINDPNARRECRIFQNQLEREFPNARFKITSNPHDSGTYYEVAVTWDEDDAAEMAAALEVEGKVPLHWDAIALEEIRQSESPKPSPLSVGAVLEAQKKRDQERRFADSLAIEELESMVIGDQDVACADGCIVEPDGHCPHGYTSPLLILGIM